MSGPVVIIPGHRPGSPGARTASGDTEWAWCSVLARQVITELEGLGIRAMLEARGDALAYEPAMRALVRRIDPLQPVCVVELHYNAGPEKVIPRTEALVWLTGSPAHALGRELAARVSGVLPSAGRRAPETIQQRASWNGPGLARDASGRPVPDGPPLYVLSLTSCPAVILETHYGSHPADHAAATAARDSGALARAIAGGIGAWLAGGR